MNHRKPTRLQSFDYSSNGVYFVTLCVEDMKRILSQIVGEGFHALPDDLAAHPDEAVGEGFHALPDDLAAHPDEVVGEGFNALPDDPAAHPDEVVGEGFHALPKVLLTPIGKEVESAIRFLNRTNDTIQITKYVIMPNHVHMLVTIQLPENGEGGGCGNPPLQEIVKRLKTYTTRKYGSKLWQRTFFDHIIRNGDDYAMHLQYIEENPKKWLMGKDDYYA